MSRSPPPDSEAAFLATVIAYARLHGWLVWHDYHSKRNTRGWPDLVLVRSGRLIIAELKSEAGRLRVEQIVWLHALAECGIETHVWRPSDLPEIIAILTRPTRSRSVFVSACLAFAS